MMPRPIKIPGAIGALAEKLGLQALANAMSTELAQTHPGTLRKWGKNHLPTPGPAGALLSRLCDDYGIKPMLYTHPGLPVSYVTSLPDGWVMWSSAINGWKHRVPYHGHTEGLVAAPKSIILCARIHGWPW